MFGVYQTLLGWRGARARSWFLRGHAQERLELSDSILRKVRADVEARPNVDRVLEEIGRIGIGVAHDQPRYPSKLIEAIAANFSDGDHLDDPQFWKNNLTDDMLLASLNREVRKEAKRMLEPPDDPNAQLDRLAASPVADHKKRSSFSSTNRAPLGSSKLCAMPVRWAN